MSSALFLLMYTAVMVLSLLTPGKIVLWLTLSVILVSAAYLIGVWYPFLFTRTAWILGYRWLLLPLPVLIFAAVLIPQKTAVLWLLYAGTLIVGWLLPLVRYLVARLRLYGYLRGKCGFGEIMLGGRKTPLTVTLKTADGPITVGILGTPGTSRYGFVEENVISQPVRALSASVLGEVEDSAARWELTGAMLLLAGKETSVPFDAPETEDAYLFVHPHCIMMGEKGNAGLGERVGGYSLVSMKTVLSALKRGK